jgi:UDP-glucuronate decarboxylase
MNQTETIGPINIGNPYEMSIKELSEKCLTMIDTTSKIEYKELPQDDPMKRQPDISKAKKYLNWIPQVNLDDGLQKTIKYFKEL